MQSLSKFQCHLSEKQDKNSCLLETTLKIINKKITVHKPFTQMMSYYLISLATVTMKPWCWLKSRYRGQRDMLNSTETNPCRESALILSTIAQNLQRGKDSASNKAGYPHVQEHNQILCQTMKKENNRTCIKHVKARLQNV